MNVCWVLLYLLPYYSYYCLVSRKWKLRGKNVNFSNIASLVALRVFFGFQDNSDLPFMHLLYLILHHVRFRNRIEMKTRNLYLLFHLYIVCCIILILHYNGLLRSPSASRLNQSLIKRNWQWHTFTEVRLK